VSVIAPIAERSEEIDVERARHALEVANENIAELGGTRSGAGEGGEESPEDRALLDAEAARRRAEIRLEVAGATDTRGS